MKSLQTFWIAILFLAIFPWLLLSAQSQLPEGEGKEIVASVCTQCHGLRTTTGAKHTLVEWRNVVYDMISEGAPLLDEEVEIVSQYLAKHFGFEGSSSRSSEPAGKDKIDKIHR